MEWYQQILQYHLNQQDYQSVLASCRRFGLQDPSLWVQALWAGARDIDMPSHLLVEILSVIEKERLLSPLLVVDALSNWNSVKVGDIRSFLQSVLSTEEKLTDQDQARIDNYSEETARIRKQIADMQSLPLLFQGSRCCACNYQLELPSVHFFCRHSFHQHCFQSVSESENECPACLPNNKQILDFIKAQEQGRDLHETFHSELGKADDGFTLVADYFGRGVFNRLTILNELNHRTSRTSVNSHISSSPHMLTNVMDSKQVVQSSANRTPVTRSDTTQSKLIRPKEDNERIVIISNPVGLQPTITRKTAEDSLSEIAISPNQSHKVVSLNPFDEDDYPAEFNPFEDSLS